MLELFDPEQDRQSVLGGHRSGRINTHYSAAELGSVMELANRVCEGESRKTPELMMTKKKALTAVAASA